MPERSIVRAATVKGYATPSAVPVYVNSSDNTLKMIPAGSGTTEVSLVSAAQASGSKVAAGTATFVSGAVTVATGLTSVLGFDCSLIATGFATGATEITTVAVVTITTGAVALQGYRLMTTTASASGTGVLRWIAVGQ